VAVYIKELFIVTQQKKKSAEYNSGALIFIMVWMQNICVKLFNYVA